MLCIQGRNALKRGAISSGWYCLGTAVPIKLHCKKAWASRWGDYVSCRAHNAELQTSNVPSV